MTKQQTYKLGWGVIVTTGILVLTALYLGRSLSIEYQSGKTEFRLRTSNPPP